MVSKAYAQTIVDAIEDGTSTKKFNLTADMIEVIDLARQANDADDRHIPITALAQALKNEFKIQFTIETIRVRIKDHVGGKW